MVVLRSGKDSNVTSDDLLSDALNELFDIVSLVVAIAESHGISKALQAQTCALQAASQTPPFRPKDAQ